MNVKQWYIVTLILKLGDKDQFKKVGFAFIKFNPPDPGFHCRHEKNMTAKYKLKGDTKKSTIIKEKYHLPYKQIKYIAVNAL